MPLRVVGNLETKNNFIENFITHFAQDIQEFETPTNKLRSGIDGRVFTKM